MSLMMAFLGMKVSCAGLTASEVTSHGLPDTIAVRPKISPRPATREAGLFLPGMDILILPV